MSDSEVREEPDYEALSAEELFQNGKSLFKEKKYLESAECFSRALEKKSGDDPVHHSLRDYYLWYADALLTNEEQSSNIFSSSVNEGIWPLYALSGPDSSLPSAQTVLDAAKQTEANQSDETLAFDLFQFAHEAYANHFKELEASGREPTEQDVLDASYCLMRLGDMFFSNHQFEESSRMREKHALGTKHLASLYISLAQSQMFNGRLAQSLETFNRSRELLRRLLEEGPGEEDRVNLENTLEDVGIQAEDLGRLIRESAGLEGQNAKGSQSNAASLVPKTTSALDARQLDSTLMKPTVIDISVGEAVGKKRRIDLSKVYNFAPEAEFRAADSANPYPPGMPHSKIAARMYEDSLRSLESNPVSNDIMSNLLQQKRAEDYASWMADRVSKYTACSNVIAKEIASLYTRDDLNFEDWQYLVIYKKFHKILCERGNCSKETITYLIYKLIGLVRNDLTLRNLLMISSEEYVEHLLTKFVEVALNESIYECEHSRPEADEQRMKSVRKHLQRSTAAASMAHSASRLWGWAQDQAPAPYPIAAPSQLKPENYYVYERQLRGESAQGDGISVRDGCIPVPRVLYRQNDQTLYEPLGQQEAPYVCEQQPEKKSSKRYGPRGPYKRTLIRMRMREISQKRKLIRNKQSQNQSFFLNSDFDKPGEKGELKKKDVDSLSTSDRTDEASNSDKNSQRDQSEADPKAEDGAEAGGSAELNGSALLGAAPEAAGQQAAGGAAEQAAPTRRRSRRKKAELMEQREKESAEEREKFVRVTRNSRRTRRNAKSEEATEEKNEADAEPSGGNLDIRNEKRDGEPEARPTKAEPSPSVDLEQPAAGCAYEQTTLTRRSSGLESPNAGAAYARAGFNYLNLYPDADVQEDLLSRHIINSSGLAASQGSSEFDGLSDLYGPYTIDYLDGYQSRLGSEPASEELSPNFVPGLARDAALGRGLARDVRLFERRNRDMGLFEDVLGCNLVYYREDGDLIGRELNRFEAEVSPLNKFLFKNPFHAKPLPESLRATRRSTRLSKAKGAPAPPLEAAEGGAGPGLGASLERGSNLSPNPADPRANSVNGAIGTNGVGKDGAGELCSELGAEDSATLRAEPREKRGGDDTVWDMVQKHHKSSHALIPSAVRSVSFSTAVEANDDMSLLIREHCHVSENVPSSQTQPYANAYRNPKSVKWSCGDTKRFYSAIETFGTDLLLVRALLPEFTDRQVYDKFKLEERKNPQLMQNALQTHKSISLKQFEQRHGKIDVNTHYNPLTDPLLREEDTPGSSALQLNPCCAGALEGESQLKVDDKIISLFM